MCVCVCVWRGGGRVIGCDKVFITHHVRGYVREYVKVYVKGCVRGYIRGYFQGRVRGYIRGCLYDGDHPHLHE